MNLSLQVRQLVAASILLTLFFGLTGIALDEAFQHSAAAALRLRLETLGYALMGTVQTDAESPQLIVKQLPIPALSQANSGLYASIRVLPGGPVWNSPSALGFDIIYPAIGTMGQWVYDSSNLSSGAELVTATYTALWEATGQRMMFQVAADAEVLATEVGAFRASLWRWLGGLVLVLLLLQTLLLRWSLGPLRRVGDELRQVESGHKSQLDDDYPQELRGLTSSLNSFIHREQRRLQRYRDTLSDLAHSLKTPIAVIRGAMEGRASPDELRSATQEQLDRMNQIVDYQLHRAATSGQVALAAPTVIAPLADKLIRSLQRIHHQRAIQCDVEIPPTLSVRMEQGDLMEILGNVLDNAFKWAATRISLSACKLADGPQGSRLVLQVEDDGPGIPDDDTRDVLQRGVRADQSMPGHGVGLATVSGIVAEYGGVLTLSSGREGGARISMVFPDH